MIDIFATWVTDARHRRLPDRHRQARQHGVLAAVRAGASRRTPPTSGNDDFFMFGEVFDADPAFTSRYTHRGQAPGRPSTSRSRAARGRLRRRRRRDQRACATCSPQDDLYTDAGLQRLQRCRPSWATTTWAGSAWFIAAANPGATTRAARPRPAGARADVPHPRAARSSTTATSRASPATAATRTRGRTCCPARSPPTTTTT